MNTNLNDSKLGGKNLKIALASSALVVLFAFMFVPSVSGVGYTGTLTCVSPASCSSGTISAGGPGNTVIATYLLTSDAPGGTTVYFYACQLNATSCGSTSGSSQGWSWSMLTTSATTASDGSISNIKLSITAPSPASAGDYVQLNIFACSQSGANVDCAGSYLEVAGASLTTTVAEFGLGIGLAAVIGLIGMLFIVRRKGLALPSTTTI